MASDESSPRLAEWFRDFRGPLRRFLGSRRGLGSADTDDIAQEVFLRLLQYDRETLVSDPRSYLFKVAANVASEWSMRAAQRMPHNSAWLDDLIDGRDVTQDMETSQQNADLTRALGHLTPRAREILRLHYGDGLTHELIAQRLGVTRRVVKRDIIAAYAQLRLVLGS